MRQVIGRPMWFVVFVMLCLGFAGAAYAQQNSEITGIVTDQTGAVISGAQVSLTDVARGNTLTTTSNEAGYYAFPALNIGTYDLKAAAKGFQTFVSNGLVLNVSQTLRADVKMQVGTEATTVTVQASALQVQTDENVISTTISAQQVEKIATENRNFAALAALGLGVSSSLPDSNTPTSVAANFTISVNGLRQSHNIWLIDGGEADDRGGAGGMDIMPSQDAIAQFEMLTSNYPPDYGISSGATISLALKSGGEHYHGEAWEFNREHRLRREQLLQQVQRRHAAAVAAALQHFRRQSLAARCFLSRNRARRSSSGTRNGGASFSRAAYRTTRPSLRRTFRR